jgi:hypothetical protein
MDDETRRAIRFLKAYAIGTTTLLIVLGLAAFRRSSTPHFDEIDVGRINVREPDGTLRLAISNKASLPEPVIGGKSYPLRGGDASSAAGMIFFNDEGNENGGLTWAGKQTPQGYSASAGLSFDQFNQDETVTLSYADKSGQRHAGLLISDRPNVSIQAFADSAMAIRKLPDGPEKTRRAQALREGMITRGEVPASRVYVGKEADKQAVVMLADPQGRPRLRLSVDSLGAAKIEFLDENGHVTSQLPSRTQR